MGIKIEALSETTAEDYPSGMRDPGEIDHVPATEQYTRFEECYREGDRLWRLGVQAEEEGRLEDCGSLYEEAHRSYIDAVWYDSNKQSKLDWTFCLKLASTEVGIARYGDHSEYEGDRAEYFFTLAEKSYRKAARLVPTDIAHEEIRVIEGIILSQTADLYIIRGITDEHKQKKMLREAKHALEKAEGCVSDQTTACHDTGVPERIQVQKGIIRVIEGGQARVRNVHPKLGALLVGALEEDRVAA